MSTRRIQLVPGAWFAGYHAPFFVSNSMVRNAIAQMGLTNIQQHDRKDPLPAHVNPKLDPRYRDSWDTWLSAT
jgi:hypothetical protein